MNKPSTSPSTAPVRDDYPGALSGGESNDGIDHRIGETTRHTPKSDEIDPARAEPRPEQQDGERNRPPA